ncbi:hypothetical protein [Nafulsella turpanensis]|uniref:hypothetical protein n=1 Tax=Nafulsella turpanensis TaxID=1265690 RepID=UPI00034712CF|nr:hypothetical protein [Nafulsella turpanensis]
MDIKALDKALTALVEKKNELAGLNYNDPKYDDAEEELHSMEDDFVSQYGEYLEDALHVVHDDICPDNDVLLPIAYLADKYQKVGEKPDGSPLWDTDMQQGVLVDVDDYPGKPARLVFVPNPTRLMLMVSGVGKEEVWTAK